MNLKKVFKAVTGALALCLLFIMVSCANPSSGGSGNGGTVETEEQKSLYGTYWGSLTVAGQSYDMALVANGKTASLYSTMMTQSYPLVKYVKNADGTYTLHCYNSGENTTADSTHVKVTFTLGENGSVTCVPLIVPMAQIATFSTCTKGNAYNGEYDQGQGGQQGGGTTYPDVAQDTLYGSYWGKYMGYESCWVIKADSLGLYSSQMSGDYGYVCYKKDSSTNQWTLECYKTEEDYNQRLQLNQGARITIEFDTSKETYTAVGTVKAMGTASSELEKGLPYDNRYHTPVINNFDMKSMTLSEAITDISTVTESTYYKLSGAVEESTFANLLTALKNLAKNTPDGVYAALDFSDVTGLTTIPDNALKSAKRLAAITLPSTVTSIGTAAFNSTSIQSLEIPDSVTSIGAQLCNFCTSLNTLKIGNGIKEIPQSAFNSCPLTSLEWGENIEIIGDNAFLCPDRHIEEIILPESVKSIGKQAFSGASNGTTPKKIYIGKNVESIGQQAFEYNVALEQFEVSPQNNYFESDGAVLYTKGKETLVSAPTASGVFTIQSGVKKIYPFAFRGLANVTKIIVPDSVTEIGASCFQNCHVSEVILGSGITAIPTAAFNNSKITSITIPEGVTSIGKNAFSVCKDLEEVIMTDNVTSIDEGAFKSCEKLESITLSRNISVICTGTFNNSGLKSIVIPDSVTEIQGTAFASCKSLESVTLSRNLTTIAMGAFSSSALKSVVIPDSVETIGSNAFGSTSLESVTLGSGLKTIEGNVFSNTQSLKSITIPSQVTKIGKNAFNKSAIESVTFEDTTGSWYATDSTDYTGGEKIEDFPSSTDKAANATALNTTYKGKYLYKVNE